MRKKYYVSARLEFCYGKYHVNPLQEEFTSDDINLVRDKEEEERLISILYEILEFSGAGRLLFTEK